MGRGEGGKEMKGGGGRGVVLTIVSTFSNQIRHEYSYLIKNLDQTFQKVVAPNHRTTQKKNLLPIFNLSTIIIFSILQVKK